MSSLDSRAAQLSIQIPAKCAGALFEPHRYKVLHGGRGGAKSWAIARALIAIAHTRSKSRILCAREFQTSIEDSVHQLLDDQIKAMGLAPWFIVQKQSIVHRLTGSEFLFEGLRYNIQEVKSKESVDICWVEEAERVSEASWKTLIPTIRKDGSEIWISFNPENEDSSTYVRFVKNPPPSAIVIQMNWSDNPWFPKTLDDERRHMLATDPDAYEHVWGGGTLKISEATVFRNKYSIRAFETPKTGIDTFYYGADWGFSNDPTVLLRCWINGMKLMVDYAEYGYKVEIDHTAALFDRVPGSRTWPIRADSSRPETISYMRRQGFNIEGARKWEGCVEDGIAHLRGFEEIVIHERCEEFGREARLYSHKVDKRTGRILPTLVDLHNHGWDAARYSLDGFIDNRGGLGVWEKLAG